MRNKVLGMLVGGAIGDALGMPVETWTPERIREVHTNGVTKYVDPIEHKWFTNDPNGSKTYMPAGTVTDDTQLTIATAKGLIAGHETALEDVSFAPYMDAIASEHVKAMQQTTAGWGKSTVEAIERIQAGIHWSESGKTDVPQRGTGNGIPMKCSPLAIWQNSRMRWKEDENEKTIFNNQPIIDYAAMTHYTKMSAQAGIYHTAGVRLCLIENPEYFKAKYFLNSLWHQTWGLETASEGYTFDISHLNNTDDKLEEPIDKLMKWSDDVFGNPMTVDNARAAFGNGSCYVYDSLPFSYFWFTRDPNSLMSVIRTVNAGGDTDTNAKMVGELIGALHGLEFFQTEENKWAIEGLLCYDEIISLGNHFCDVFGIE